MKKNNCKWFVNFSLNNGRKSIKIVPTGWANTKEVISLKENEYIVPYSSHSNFPELEKFVASLEPSRLKCVVRQNKNSNIRIGNIKHFSSYMFTLKNLKQRGYDFLLKKYVNIKNASKNYIDLMKKENQEKLMIELGIKLSEEEEVLRDKRIFEEENGEIYFARRNRK